MNRFYLILTLVSVFMNIASSKSGPSFITKQKNDHQESVLNQTGLMDENQFLNETVFNSGLKPKEEIQNIKFLDGNIKKRQAEEPYTETTNSYSESIANLVDEDSIINDASPVDSEDKVLTSIADLEKEKEFTRKYASKVDSEDKDITTSEASGIFTVEKTTLEIGTTPKSTTATLPTATQSTKITEKTTPQKEKEVCPECPNSNLMLILFVFISVIIFLIVILAVCIIMVKRKKINIGQIVGFRKSGNEDKKTESVVLIDASQTENQNDASKVDELEPKTSNANLSSKSPTDVSFSPEGNALTKTDEAIVASPEDNVLTKTEKTIVASPEEMPKDDENKTNIESSQNQSDQVQCEPTSGMEPISDQAEVSQEAQVNSIEPRDGKESAIQEIVQDVI